LPALPLFNFTAKADWSWQRPFYNGLYGTDISSGSGTASPDYAVFWVKSFKYFVPDSGSKAQARIMNGLYKFNINTKPVGSIVTLNAYSKASNENKLNSTSAKINVELPFIKGIYSGSFNMNRLLERGIFDSASTNTGGNAGDDFKVFGESLAGAKRVLTAIPFYALFDKLLAEKFKEDVSAQIIRGGKNESASFEERYIFNFRISAIKGLKALFVPSSFETGIARNIALRYDTLQDILTVNGALNFEASNLFGALGSRSFFKFYDNDEFRYSIRTAVSIPKNDDVSWSTSFEEQMILFSKNKNEIKLASFFNILKDGYVLSASLEWDRLNIKSILGRIYGWTLKRFKNKSFSPALSSMANKNEERINKEKAEVAFDYSNEDNPFWSVNLSHESIVRIKNRFEVGVFSILSFVNKEYETRELNTFTISITIGCNMTLNF